MESKSEMLSRHARELAELESRWWEEDFTEDPIWLWINCVIDSGRMSTEDWIRKILPTIIRKREKIGVTVSRDGSWYTINYTGFDGIKRFYHSSACGDLVEYLAGRALAPGESVEILASILSQIQFCVSVVEWK